MRETFVSSPAPLCVEHFICEDIINSINIDIVVVVGSVTRWLL